MIFKANNLRRQEGNLEINQLSIIDRKEGGLDEKKAAAYLTHLSHQRTIKNPSTEIPIVPLLEAGQGMPLWQNDFKNKFP